MKLQGWQSVLLIVGIPVGLFHWYLASQAVFVFRQGEPVSSWVAILSGPTITLPLVVIGLWFPKWAGIFLIIGSILTGYATSIGTSSEDVRDLVLGVAKIVSGPMAILGIWLLIGARQRSIGQNQVAKTKTSNQAL